MTQISSRRLRLGHLLALGLMSLSASAFAQDNSPYPQYGPSSGAPTQVGQAGPLGLSERSISAEELHGRGHRASHHGSDRHHPGSAYLTDSSGQVVRSGSGLCWRLGYWDESQAREECDPSARPEPTPIRVVQSPPVTMVPSEPIEPPTHFAPLSGRVHFEFDRSKLSSRGVEVVRILAQEFQEQRAQNHVFVVVGHTDRIGRESYNEQLSLDRAQVVKDTLVSFGISPALITISGAGSQDPEVFCDDQKRSALIECLAPNRRAMITLRIAP